jgi:hypothetical protein
VKTTVAKVAAEAVAAKHQPLLDKAKLFIQPQDYVSHKITGAKEGDRVVIVNDLQIPFQDDAMLEAVETFCADFKPHFEIYNGDIVDFYSVSKYDQNPSRVFHLQDELNAVKAWFARRVKANPTARRYMCFGNHEDRLRRWLWSDGSKLASLDCIRIESLLGLTEFNIHSIAYGSRYDLCGFLIEHGYRAAKSAAFPANVARIMGIERGVSGICGHDHRAQLYSWSTARGGHCWINNGCLCLTKLEYAPHPGWMQAFTFGYIHDHRFHPTLVLPHDRHGFVANGRYYKI